MISVRVIQHLPAVQHSRQPEPFRLECFVSALIQCQSQVLLTAQAERDLDVWPEIYVTGG
jgi:hypothetical protein